MTEKTQKAMVQELYQAVVGIKNNPDDNGMIGDIKEIKSDMKIMNGRTRANETRSKVNQAILAVIVGGGGVTTGITKLLGLW